MIFNPHPYQLYARDWILSHEACGLFLDMGLGKTAITLSAIAELLDLGEARRVLVVAPLRVAKTVWAEEAQKWDHTRHLRVVKVLGSPEQRLSALRQNADIYVINRENVVWLTNQYTRKKWPFDVVVLDELSSYKSSSAERFRALRRTRPAMRRVIGLTGTPASNGYIDLWSQVYLLDRGERLGSTVTGYRDRYFDPGRRNQAVVFDWRLKPGADKAIEQKLSDLCMSMRAGDYLSLPECVEVTHQVQLPPAARHLYEDMEKELVLELGDDIVTAANAAVATGKLLQMAGGAVYAEDGSWTALHRAKLDCLRQIIDEAQGQSVLCYYAYQHELERIKAAFPEARELRTEEDVAAWCRGEVPLLLAHPASAGHGLNLQYGGHIMVWFGLTWSLELYQQACARLHRQGQSHPVMLHRIVAEKTVDEDVLRALDAKDKTQSALMDAVKAVVDRHRKGD